MAIINNNVQNVKFLRNQKPFETRDLARQALENNKGQAADGTALLARYTITDGQTTDVKTLVGFVAEVNSTKYVTIFDTEGASADVEELRQEINAKLGGGITSENTATAQLAALSGATFTAGTSSSADTSVEGAKAYAYDLIGTLDYTDTAETGYYVSKVDETDGVINVTREALPTVSAISEAGKPITAVSESLGTISASAGTIDAQYVNIADNGDKFTATTVEGALAELDAKISGAVETLEHDDTAEAKKFVIAVDESNGVISVDRGEITSRGETIVLTDNDDGGVNFEVHYDGTTIIQDPTTKELKVASSALVQYAGDEYTIHITDVVGDTKTVSSLLTISATTPTDSNVREQYNLVGAGGNTIGATIKIYNDSSVVEIYVGTNYDSVNTTTGVVDKKQIGDVVDEHTIVTEDFQYLNYVYQKADGTYEMVKINLGNFLIEPEFKSGVTVSNGVVIGVVDNTSEPFLTVGADGFKLAGVQNAIDTAVSGAVQTLDADVSGNTTHVTVNVVEADGVITGVNVAEDNIANASDLAALSAKTVTEVGSSNTSISATTASTANGTVSVDLVTDASKIKMSGFTSTDALSGINSSSSITEAFKEVDNVITHNEEVTAAALTDLDGRLDVVEADYISGVSVNGTAVTVANKIAPISIAPATSAATATSTEAIVVDTDANGNITLGIANIDCGYYDGTQG